MCTTCISLSDMISSPVQVKRLATGRMEFIIIFCTWVGAQILIVTHMLRLWKQCHIKMLPDVGMEKVYPKCVLKAANVDWVVTQTRNTPPCSWPISTSWFSMLNNDDDDDTYVSQWIGWCNWAIYCRPISVCINLWNQPECHTCMTLHHIPTYGHWHKNQGRCTPLFIRS